MRVLCVGAGVVCVLLHLLLRTLALPAKDTPEPAPPHPAHQNVTGSCDCVCGQSGRKMRIVGGEEAEVHEFPWIVLLSYRGKFYCGGTLLTSRHILTAAHCTQQIRPEHVTVTIGEHNRNVTGTEVQTRRVLRMMPHKHFPLNTFVNDTAVLEMIRPEHVTVTIGEHNRNVTGTEVQTRRVLRMMPHKHFTLNTFVNDIAVLEMDSPVDITGPAIRPACLPLSDGELYAGRSAVVAGWGRLSERKQTSNSLQKVTVPIMTTAECRSKGYPNKKITEGMICAGYLEGKKDACQGDSGGPLHTLDAYNVTEVIGIVSWGRGCARPNFPGVYTRVARYLGWIDEMLGGECRCTRRAPMKTRTPRARLV